MARRTKEEQREFKEHGIVPLREMDIYDRALTILALIAEEAGTDGIDEVATKAKQDWSEICR